MNPASSKLRERHKEATRHAILDAAEEAFARSGPGVARMEDIAAQSGVAVGTLYNYFSDRESLLQAVVETRAQELMTRMDEALAGSSGFMARLEALVATSLDHFDRHRGLWTALIEGGNHGKKPKFKLQSRIEGVLREGVKAGALRADDADLYPAMLLGLLRGVVLRGVERKDPAPFAAQASRITRFFLAGAAP